MAPTVPLFWVLSGMGDGGDGGRGLVFLRAESPS